jgi:hypothetical protein
MVWQQNKLNGKESPKGSLLKHTAHTFLKQLKREDKADLYKVNMANKSHEIWQRDSLGIEIYSRLVAMQKLEYALTNPVKGLWQLAKDDISYYYSSAKFYETGVEDFSFLKICILFLMASDLVGSCATNQGWVIEVILM